MTAFESLSYEAQLDRFADAAEHILPAFGFIDHEVTPLQYVNNAVFAVDGPRGQYVLRVHRRGHKPIVFIASEMRWLADIHAQTDLCVPEPVPTLEGTLLTPIQIEGVPEPLSCVLLSWVEGTACKPEDTTPEQAARLGTFLARLHNFSAIYAPPAGFIRPRLDWEGLFGEHSPYNPGPGARIFTPEQVQVMGAVARQVRQVMQTLDQESQTFGLIHADFIAKNYLFHGDQVCAIDFEDCAFGYYLYDLAPPLLNFSPLPGYADLKAALWAGYTAVRPLPDSLRDDLETFVAGRHVASCRWIAGNLDNPHVRDRAPHILENRRQELEGFLETGRLERKSEIL
ncbi:MAG: phosphotransferase [Anaerolineae bacterium]|nr:phosphotransferase [Anaerolineae bacterium]